MEQNGKPYFTGFPETYKHLSPMEINPEIQLCVMKAVSIMFPLYSEAAAVVGSSVLQITRSKG